MRALGDRLPTSVSRLGCLTLLALPFAAIGTMVAYLTLHTLVRVAVEQRWPTVPATLQSVEIKSVDSSNERLVTSYTYVVQGKQYTGHRLSVYTSDNLGTFRQDAYAELRDYLARKEPYPAHVNPKAPDESVLKPVLRWEAIGLYLVFVIVFGGPGWAIIISSCGRLITARREAILCERYPDEPWKQRVAWSKPEIKSSQGIDAIMEVSIALFWNVATFPVLAVVPAEVASGRYVALTFLAIPLVGAGLAWWAVVALARATRFAKTYLHLDTMPGRPGQQLRGHVYAPKALAGASDVAITLRCERTYGDTPTNGGRTSSKAGFSGTEDIWRHDSPTQVIRSQDPNGQVKLAVTIDLPAGFPNSWRGQGDQFSWLLSANAPLRGADFSVEFEVPVYDA
jgi:hypothetical protein